MAEVKTDQEPSIEEILESIRQIISDDGTPQTSPPAAAPKPVAPEKPAPTAKPMEEAVLDLVEKADPMPAAIPEQPIAVQPSPAPAQTLETPMDENIPDSGSLMSRQTADTAADALSKVLTTDIAVEKDDVSRVGKVTLEEITLTLMKPMIKAWLDNNLPGIVEKAVQKEVEKLSRRAQDR